MYAPLPPNEEERLEALQRYEILDTLPEESFDRLARLAASFFDVPIALIALVDAERQWIKACFGTDMRQSPRELSFCAHSLLSEQVLVVPDALLDPRFVRNPLVTGPPHIRFYAGAPLRTRQGLNLGTLCVVDAAPRQFSPQNEDALADMASIVMDELELRLAAQELRSRGEALRAALRQNSQLSVAISGLTSGVTITNPHLPDNPIVFANRGFCLATGYSLSEIIGQNCRFLQGVGSDPAIVQGMRQAIASHSPWKAVILNYRKDGTPFQNEVTICPVFDELGRLISFVGLQSDVTEREQTKQLLEQRVQERTSDLAQSQIEILQRLARAAEFRDDDTGQHTQRVGRTSALIAQALGLPEEQVEQIRQAAPLHDVGKIAVSDRILLKPGKLSDEEYATMRVHATIGASLLSDGHSEVVQMAERIAGTHHERWDGTGYPLQMAGDTIPLEGRILAVADVFDALTHARTYKRAWAVEASVAEIARLSGKQFDPRIVEAFLTLDHANLV